MNRTDDLIGDIDALIDDQLAQGEAVAEARADDADRPCGHCGSDWHGLPITERLEEMRLEYGNRVAEARRRGEEPEYADSAIIDGYRYADDDSEVLCPGSEFIGALTAAQVGFAENGRSCTCPFWTLAAARRTSFAAMVGGQVPTWMMPPRPIRGRARWLRADFTHLRDAEMVDIDIEYTTMSVFGLSTRVRGPSRNAVLTIVVNHVRASLELVPAASYDFAVRDVAYDMHNPDATYLRALTIHTREDPPDLGGQLEWVEVDGPHGDPIVWSSSTEVQPYGWDWALLIAAGLRRPQFDWGGVIWGAPWVVWRDGAIAEGDRVGVEIDGRVFVGEVTNPDPSNFTIAEAPASRSRSGRLLSAWRRLGIVP